MVEWGNYAEAFKAVHDRLDEILTKLDYPTDPAIQDVIDRADRLLGKVYGDQGVVLAQRPTTHELKVQLYHQGTEYQAGGGAGGLVQCQIRNAANDAWINEPFARRVQGSQGQDLLQRATTYDSLVQLRHAGAEIDPRQIRALTSSDVVTVVQTTPANLRSQVYQAWKDRTITDVTKVVTQKIINLTATGVIHTPAAGKKIRIKAFVWSSDADIVTALRFGTTGDLLFAIQAKGVIGMNLVGCNIEGAVDEALYGYLSGTGTMKGTVLIEEI